LELLIDEEWINIYDLIDIDDIESRAIYQAGFIGLIKNYRKQLTKNPRLKVDPDEYWRSI